MSIDNAPSGPSSGASRLAERFVDTTIRTESLLARGMYWVWALIALLLLGWAGLCINQAVQTGKWRDGLLYAAILCAVAAVVYFLGWGWRWLWSGRNDHLFGRKRYTTPGRLDDARQKVATVVSFGAW
jgi:hypothetical protein